MGFLDSKVALVTGGNRGIGRGIVEALSREGATVALTSRTAAAAEAAAREVGNGARGFACDVRSEEQVHRLFADLDGAASIEPRHLSEAIQYRTLDRSYWA